MTRKELIKSQEYWMAQIQLNLFELIENYRKKNNLNKVQLAAHLGVTKSYITQILNGDFDHKVSKLVELSLAFGKAPILQFVDFEKYIAKDGLISNEGSLSKSWPPQIKQTHLKINKRNKEKGLQKKPLAEI